MGDQKQHLDTVFDEKSDGIPSEPKISKWCKTFKGHGETTMSSRLMISCSFENPRFPGKRRRTTCFEDKNTEERIYLKLTYKTIISLQLLAVKSSKTE